MDADRYIYPYGEYADLHVAEACAEKGGDKALLPPGAGGAHRARQEYKTNFTESLYTYLSLLPQIITNAANTLHLHSQHNGLSFKAHRGDHGHQSR
jgi:hypothetical protein